MNNTCGDTMKRIVLIYALLCIFTLMIVLTQYNFNSNVLPDNEVKILRNSSSDYVLRSENNKLQLYKANKKIKSFDISPAHLPLTDQDNLRSGIILESYDDVLKIIEDFDG